AIDLSKSVPLRNRKASATAHRRSAPKASGNRRGSNAAKPQWSDGEQGHGCASVSSHNRRVTDRAHRNRAATHHVLRPQQTNWRAARRRRHLKTVDARAKPTAPQERIGCERRWTTAN